MRILLLHPNYHSGGAEIAGNWPPAWAAYIAGALKQAGFGDVRFVDAMTNNLADERFARSCARKSQTSSARPRSPHRSTRPSACCRSPGKSIPHALTVLGGIHATFMYQQVLTEAPWIDAIVRGEGEEIFVNLVARSQDGHWPAERARHQRPRVPRSGQGRRDGGGADGQGPRCHHAGLEGAGMEQVHLHPAGHAASPSRTWRAAARSPAVSARSGNSGATIGCAIRSRVVDEIEALVRDHDVGFFILADEEPTINRKKFIAFCEELIRRDLRNPLGHQHAGDRHPARRGTACRSIARPD